MITPLVDPVHRRVVSGAAWLFGSYVISKAARLGIIILIAALLSPREYGVITLTLVITGAAQILSQFGIWQAVIQRRVLDGTYLNTAFTSNLLGGTVVALALMLGAPTLAEFYNEPELTTILRIMSVAVLCDVLFYVPDGLLRKELRFRTRVVPELTSTAAAVATTIPLLLLGVGVVSYAIGFVVESATRCTLTWNVVHWRPRLAFSRSAGREIRSYGKHVVGADLVSHVSVNVDYVAVGRMLGAHALGLYSIAFTLANYPVGNFAQILSRIAFPAFARVQDDRVRARSLYLKMIEVTSVIALPTLIALALVADLLIRTLFGEVWEEAIRPLQVLVVAGFSRTLASVGSDMLRAIGAPQVPFKVSAAEGIMVLLAVLAIGSRGINAVAVTVSVLLSATAWTTTVATCRRLGVELAALARSLAPSAALGGSVAGGMLIARSLDLPPDRAVAELVASMAFASVGAIMCAAALYGRLVIVLMTTSVRKEKGAPARH